MTVHPSRVSRKGLYFQPMDSKSVVMIAYFFPPEGNAAVYRPLRFIKELVKKGWHVRVISCKPYKYERYDAQLLEQVPSVTRIDQVRGWDPWRVFQARRAKLAKEKLAGLSEQGVRQIVAGYHVPWRSTLRELIRTAEAWIYRPDMAVGWIRPATRHTIASCRQNRPNVIWATIGPLSAGLVAYRTAQETGIPYVLDFRDPWGLEYYPHEARRPAWAKTLDNRMISMMFQKAQAVVFMFESVAQAYLKAFPALEREKIHIIPNGFEGEVEPFVHMPGDRCTILYAGTVTTYRYDTLLEGLAELKRNAPRNAAQLRLVFVGEGLRELMERVEALDIRDVVEILPPTSSAEVRRLQREAHALLILGRTSVRKGHELVAGAKLFGYLQAGRPIVGVVPYDETRRVLSEVGSSLIADVESPREIVDVFQKVLNAWLNRTLGRLVPDRAVCETYSSSRQILDLILALDGAASTKI